MLVLSCPVAARAETGAVFTPAPDQDLTALMRAIERSSPEVAAARGETQVARADLQQSKLWENPDMTAGAGTLPVGTLNPPGLARPYANVPNYSVQLSYQLPWAKRGPRIRAARAWTEARDHERTARTRALALNLAGILGELAVNTLRKEGLGALLADARHDVEAANARMASAFGTPLEVDRLRLEVQRAEQHVLATQSRIEGALAECARLLGMSCASFQNASDARSFLEAWLSRSLPAPEALAQRPDLLALAATERAHHETANLAHNSRYPDPRVYAGYMHDRFIIAGNQRNSFNAGVSVSLPVFDWGQAREKAAERRAEAAHSERDLRVHAAEAALAPLAAQLASERERQRDLSGRLVPLARNIVDQLETAVEGRLVPLGDLIQARRTLDELLVQEADSYADAFQALLSLSEQRGGEL